jgi:hypothetical protein
MRLPRAPPLSSSTQSVPSIPGVAVSSYTRQFITTTTTPSSSINTQPPFPEYSYFTLAVTPQQSTQQQQSTPHLGLTPQLQQQFVTPTPHNTPQNVTSFTPLSSVMYESASAPDADAVFVRQQEQQEVHAVSVRARAVRVLFFLFLPLFLSFFSSPSSSLFVLASIRLHPVHVSVAAPFFACSL